jgi:CBS domain-containing protein
MPSIVIGCSRGSTLLDVEKLLSTHGVSRVVVTGDNEEDPVGIVSEKDIVRFMLTDSSARALDEVRACEVMSSPLISISPEAPIGEAAELMIREGISSLAVNGARFEGIVTKGDIVGYVALTRHQTPLAKFMTPDPVNVDPSYSILSTVDLMSQRRISRVVVVDENGAPIGIITLADFTLLLLSFVSDRMPADELLWKTKASGLTAGDFMTSYLLTVEESSNLAEAAELMVKNRISGLPVVNSSSKLVGIISKTDMTRAAAKR